MTFKEYEVTTALLAMTTVRLGMTMAPLRVTLLERRLMLFLDPGLAC